MASKCEWNEKQMQFGNIRAIMSMLVPRGRLFIVMLFLMESTTTRMPNNMISLLLSPTNSLLSLLEHRGSEEEEQPRQAFVTHTDKSFTTILHQNHVNALEVETRDGQWIKVDFSSPTSFVVLAGDAITVWTNDRIQAPRHKIVMNGNERRYSLGLFTFIRGIVHVAQSLIDEQNPAKYKPFDHLELLKFSYSANIKDFCGV